MTAQPRSSDWQNEAATRRILSLDGDWEFRHEGGEARRAHVPNPWQAEFDDLANAWGRASYKRSFSVPEDWREREIALCFGAVSYVCEVLLNGTSIGSHEGGYLPFEIVLPPELLSAENQVEVRVLLPDGGDPDYPFGEIPHGKQSWYGPLGGIWQSVRIEARDPRHIAHIAVTADADGRLTARIEASGPVGGCAIALRLEGPDGSVAGTARIAAEGEVTIALDVAEPALWSLETPNLYALTAEIVDGEMVLDAVVRQIGFRTVETRDGKILLNGEPVYMRAALDQDYYPEGICTPPSLEFLEDQAKKAKELGLNTLRCHIKVPDPRYYDVADRFGLLVWTEIPNVATFTEKSAQRLRDTMAGIVRRDGSHPSIICWTLINEDWGTRLNESANQRAWLAQTYDWLKALDPTRLVVDNSACFVNFHVKTDLNDYHYYRSVPERRQEWDDITAQFAGGADWTFSTLGDAQRRGDEPLIVSEFGVWGLPDPSKLRREDGSEPFWFASGSTWGDGVAVPHGVEQRFAALQLEAVFGSFGDFIEAAQWYQFTNLKYEIEVIRAHAPIMGYVITELTDVHWEANGLLDLERTPRVFHERFAEINADIVILPQPACYAARGGEALEIKLSVATGGKAIPEGAVLRWSGDAEGHCPVPATGPVSVAEPGTQIIVLPQTAKNRMARLDFTLEAAGETLARNSLDIALYAARSTENLPTLTTNDEALAAFARGLGYPVREEAGALRLTRSLDADDIEAMRSGAAYLVLADGSAKTHGNLRTDLPAGEAPFRAMTLDSQPMGVGTDGHMPGIGLVERDGTIWRGDWIAGFSWIRRDGAFAALPGGPIIDLSFSDIVPRHLLTGARTWEYGTNVHGGHVVGWVHRPAATILERRIERGGLVATTYRLTGEAPGADPVAAALFDALVETAVRMKTN